MPKYWGETNFQPREIPRSGSKAEDGEREREKERKLVKTMAKLRMAHASTHGARKPPGPKYQSKAADTFCHGLSEMPVHLLLFLLFAKSCTNYENQETTAE